MNKIKEFLYLLFLALLGTDRQLDQFDEDVEGERIARLAEQIENLPPCQRDFVEWTMNKMVEDGEREDAERLEGKE